MPVQDYTQPDFDIYTKLRPEQWFQQLDKYSCYLWDEQRLETWPEVVARAVDTLRYLSDDKLPFSDYQEMYNLIYTHDVMPSMRLLSMPLAAIKRCNTVLYNCYFSICDTLDTISEALYLSASGVGVAWSVETVHISKLPTISFLTGEIKNYVVEDSQLGWAESTKHLLNNLVNGVDVQFDYSLIRPEGTPLKTKGGFASGPNILISTHNFLRNKFFMAQGRQLTSLEVHDMMCVALESGISGGVRRSAGACLFDENDIAMKDCKYDGFWNHPEHKYRANANNSMVLDGQYTFEQLKELTYTMLTSGTGEPGIFKRDNIIRTAPSQRQFPYYAGIGSNPCFEIGLSSEPITSNTILGGGGQFCNLSAAITRKKDTIDSLKHKTKYATLIGDIQSLATNFQFLRDGTKKICDRDRLLGVNLLGFAMYPNKFTDSMLVELKEYARTIDNEFAMLFNVPISAAITTMKPSGNSSVFNYTSPGVNPVHSVYQLRNVTVNKASTMHKFLSDSGVPKHNYPGRPYADMFTFPVSYPKNAVTLQQTSVLDQLRNWLLFKNAWAEHNVSCSITYDISEISDIQNWLYENQQFIGGLAFFPKYDSSYELLPIVTITEEQYNKFMETYPVIDWHLYQKYETTGKDERQQVAECAGGVCAIQW